MSYYDNFVGVVMIMLSNRSQPYRRMKLMFVGESNKGKTSLLMALSKKGKVNCYQDIRLNVNRKPLSTVGVDLGDWEYAKQTNILHAGKKITFMTWDFGGQVSSSLLTCIDGGSCSQVGGLTQAKINYACKYSNNGHTL